MRTENQSAQKIMDKDFHLLRSLSPDAKPVLHLYSFARPSLTYGYFLHLDEYLNRSSSNIVNFDPAKRPTGGGIIFHTCDLAFSVLIPQKHPYFSLNTLDNYAFINRKAASAIQMFCGLQTELLNHKLSFGENNFCMGKPTVYDVMHQGKKVAGGAQRRKKNGFLHQGSIALTLPEKRDVEMLLLDGEKVYLAMEHYTHPLLSEDDDSIQAKKELESLLIEVFTKDQ